MTAEFTPTIDHLRDVLVLVRAAIETDGAAVDAVLAGCEDVRTVVIALSSYAGQVTVTACHGRQPALDWLASMQAAMTDAERDSQ